MTAGRNYAYRGGMLVRQEGQRPCPGYSPQACQSVSRRHYPPWTSANTVNGHGPIAVGSSARRRLEHCHPSVSGLASFYIAMGACWWAKACWTEVRSLCASNSKAHRGVFSATFARFLHLYERGHHADHAASFVALRTHSSALPRRSRSHPASCARSERTVPRRSGVPPRRE